jgi:Tfp pilus assembly protein PilF
LQGTFDVNDAARARLAEGFARRQQHDTEGAYAAITEAATLAPDNAHIALAHAHISYETWRPAAVLFDRARALAPGNIAIVRNMAAALNSQGDGQTALALLTDTLAQHPDWIDGHKALSTIRVTRGEQDGFVDSFATAARAVPDNQALRLAWFHTLATARHWDAARDVIGQAEAQFGSSRAISLAKIFLASESDEASRDPHLFESVADMQDVGLDLCRVRFYLRTGQPTHAAAICERHVGTTAARTFWPYLSLSWRLTDNPRAAWLDGDPPAIGVYDLDISDADLDDLANTLRNLLVLQAPYIEQSVRGGIQTDRHLFFNPDPVIQRTKARLTDVVRAHVHALPPHVEGHPLLGTSRDTLKFEGSWSVLLRRQGFHACHTHTMGWLSSAFYVSLPDKHETGAESGGWISFGTPPPELGLDVLPYKSVEPKAGRLVLFPSTMWHGTILFERGERLTIAFDVAVP